MKPKRNKKRVRKNIGDQTFEALCFGDTDFPEAEFDEDWMAGCGSQGKK